MTILHHIHTVPFDPSNKKHRDAVRAFLVRNAWSDTSIRFSQDPAYGSIADQVQSKLLKWYLEKEKETTARKTEQAKSKKLNTQPLPITNNKVCSFTPLKTKKA